MKINVTVDLDDFFYEEENGNSFTEEIKAEVAYRVKQEVWAEFKKSALQELHEKLREELQKSVSGRTEEMINEVLERSEVRKSIYNPDSSITFKAYSVELVKQYAVDSSAFMNQIRGTVKAAADELGNELKQRYDILFASQLVAKMNEQGLLKDDVARLLIDNSGS